MVAYLIHGSLMSAIKASRSHCKLTDWLVVLMSFHVSLWSVAAVWRRRREGGGHWGTKGHGRHLWVAGRSHLHGQQDVVGNRVAGVLSNDAAAHRWGTSIVPSKCLIASFMVLPHLCPLSEAASVVDLKVRGFSDELSPVITSRGSNEFWMTFFWGPVRRIGYKHDKQHLQTPLWWMKVQRSSQTCSSVVWLLLMYLCSSWWCIF